MWKGHRSFDGKLPAVQKGPILSSDGMRSAGGSITIVGTHDVMPKGRFAIKRGTVTVIFHSPIEPKDFGSRECLMEKVRA